MDLISDFGFMKDFILAVYEYRPENHVNVVSRIFKLIQGFKGYEEFGRNNRFFSVSNSLCFVLAESLVTFFSDSIMLHYKWSTNQNLSAFEKSVFISKNGIKLCGLNPKIIAYLRSNVNDKDLNVNYDNILTFQEIYKPNIYFDEENEIREIDHIVYELRKLPYQTSPSSMLCIISNAMQFLKNSLSIDGKPVGADEIFQFFVYSLAAAKLPILPSLISFIDLFVDDSLRETQYQYFITQIQTAYDFIKSGLLKVSPFLLFPFKEVPENFKENIMINDEEPIILTGFEIYAFPTWKEEYKKLFPAMIRYTGDLSDIAYVYQYSIRKADFICSSNYNIDSIPTLNGSFFHLSNEMIYNYSMIKIQSGKFDDDSLNDIQLISALMLIVPKSLRNPEKYKKEDLFDIVKETWNLQKLDDICKIIAEIQKSLMTLGVNDGTFTIDGILDYETLSALKKYIDKEDIIISPYLVKRIQSNAESIFHTKH